MRVQCLPRLERSSPLWSSASHTAPTWREGTGQRKSVRLQPPTNDPSSSEHVSEQKWKCLVLHRYCLMCCFTEWLLSCKWREIISHIFYAQSFKMTCHFSKAKQYVLPLTDKSWIVRQLNAPLFNSIHTARASAASFGMTSSSCWLMLATKLYIDNAVKLTLWHFCTLCYKRLPA